MGIHADVLLRVCCEDHKDIPIPYSLPAIPDFTGSVWWWLVVVACGGGCMWWLHVVVVVVVACGGSGCM